MVKHYINMSIRKKLFLSFVFMICCSIILGIVSVIDIFQINGKYEGLINSISKGESQIYESMLTIDKINRNLNNMVLYNDFLFADQNNVKKQTEEYYSSLNELDVILDNFMVMLDEDTIMPRSVKDQSAELLLTNDDIMLDKLSVQMEDLISAFESKNKEYTKNCLEAIIGTTQELFHNFNEMLNIMQSTVEDIKTQNKSTVNSVITFTIIIILVIVIGSVVLAIITSNMLAVPMNKLCQQVLKVSNGDFNINLTTNRRDEIGILYNSVDNMVNVLNSLISDINILSDEMEQGKLSSEINTEKYNGSYKQTAKGINNLTNNLINDLNSVSECVNAYSNGDFSVRCPDMHGEKIIFTKSLEGLKNNLFEIKNNITVIASDARKGSFDKVIDINEFNGEWKSLANEINELIINIDKPINAVSDALKKIINGDLNITVSNVYSGKFGMMIDGINDMGRNLSDVVGEISDVLTKMANGNLKVQITQDYRGDFVEIKKSLQFIIDNFNNIINEIRESTNQMLISTKLVSNTSVNLAEGANNQSLAVKQLTNKINTVANNILENVAQTDKMDTIASFAKKQAEDCNNYMINMMDAIGEISEASSNISNIIKIIENIAFQTNLLALNAAVEAARTGVHGKGFAVVADEVRSLAARSHASATETTELINVSLDKVEQGIQIAKTTSESLKEILTQIDEIFIVAAGIADESKKEADYISQIKDDIKQISSVITENNSASRENSSTAEELTNRAEAFKEMVSKFTTI